ncbi:hypothetical protein MES5069_620053 [Mesorhizobium escarrei]|uniref:Transposase n=1 Tax=Mesorhizobium escarrei TaxID=666018 RepID=A0ABM9EEI1_9HYPH|nr:hypothetical protein MES5069_620053 [Mesorhizobium escarrei]
MWLSKGLQRIGDSLYLASCHFRKNRQIQDARLHAMDYRVIIRFAIHMGVAPETANRADS